MQIKQVVVISWLNRPMAEEDKVSLSTTCERWLLDKLSGMRLQYYESVAGIYSCRLISWATFEFLFMLVACMRISYLTNELRYYGREHL